MVLRATPVARAVAATPPWPALCASAATCNRRARSSSDGRTASNRSAMGFSSIIPPPYRDHGAARITQPLKAPTDALISGRRLSARQRLHGKQSKTFEALVGEGPMQCARRTQSPWSLRTEDGCTGHLLRDIQVTKFFVASAARLPLDPNDA